MYQFFVEPGAISEKQVVITGKDVNHIKNVLRMKVGEEIAVSNGVDGREYRCGILQMTEDAVICELRFIKEDGVELPSKIYLFQGLTKADKMELIIQNFYRSGRRICIGGDRAGNGTCHAADHAGQADPADGNSRYDSAFDFDVYTRRTGTESVKNA